MVYTVCSGLFLPILRANTVDFYVCFCPDLHLVGIILYVFLKYFAHYVVAIENKLLEAREHMDD